jgi:hypothetical protein
MAKIKTIIGYAETREDAPGVYVEHIIERTHFCELSRVYKKWAASEHLNDDLVLSQTISLLADSFAYQNFHLMRYIVLSNSKWKITNIEVRYPRLILTTGGVYNG